MVQRGRLGEWHEPLLRLLGDQRRVRTWPDYIEELIGLGGRMIEKPSGDALARVLGHNQLRRFYRRCLIGRRST
jgi:hypothetical protein